jgi:steroid delta-isomerase-like uncharacterized protein
MSEQDNIHVAQAWLDAMAAHDFDKLKELRSPDYVLEHPALGTPVGGAEEDTYLHGLSNALPDWHWEIVKIIAQGDFVVINGIRRGTQTGIMTDLDIADVPATGKELVLRISNTLEIKDGKVARSSVYYDRLSMLKQLGQVTSW